MRKGFSSQGVIAKIFRIKRSSLQTSKFEKKHLKNK